MLAVFTFHIRNLSRAAGHLIASFSRPSLGFCHEMQEEIRGLGEKMLKLVKPLAVNIFAQAGPSCLNGICPENDEECPAAGKKEG